MSSEPRGADGRTASERAMLARNARATLARMSERCPGGGGCFCVGHVHAGEVYRAERDAAQRADDAEAALRRTVARFKRENGGAR